MARAIGIDLGTTNSCAAIVEDGVPRVIAWPDGSKTIPSVFAIDRSGKRLVGAEAKAQASLNPENTVAAAKRLIGRTFGSEAVDQMSQVFTYELLQGDDDEVLVSVANQVMTLEQVSAAILMRIRENASEALGEPVDAAVITVPAYFNDRQRQAVRAAGQLAGLDVLRILNEPTAAALAYGMGKALNQRVFVYDLGGGTFDVCLIDIQDRVFHVVRSGGDTFLGGVDFDDRVMQVVLEDFYREHGIDLSYDRVAITRIRDACEIAKIELSNSDSTEISLNAIAEAEDGSGPIDLTRTLTRDQLEEMTRDLVERSIETSQRVFQEAETTPNQIDEVLLVGGQARMPLVRRRLEAFLGRPPSERVHPDEAVALGAAIMASSLTARRRKSSKASKKKDKPSDVTLHDLLPMPIGIGRPDGKMHELFPKNEPLPAEKSRTLTTNKDSQRSISLKLFQGDGTLTSENELLGMFIFHGLRDAAKGEVEVEVTFAIDGQGILDVRANDKATGEPVATQIRLADDTPRPVPAPEPSLPSQAEAERENPAPLDDASPFLDTGGAPDAAPAQTPATNPATRTIDNLRAQQRQRPLPMEEEKKPQKGFLAWMRRMFGGKS
jgi:molecular chaperone DnaK